MIAQITIKTCRHKKKIYVMKPTAAIHAVPVEGQKLIRL